MAASGFATPSLSWNSPNLPEAFCSFRQHSTLIFDGPFANKSEKEKVTYLLLWIGSHGRDIYDGWTWTTPDDKFKLQIVLDKWRLFIIISCASKWGTLKSAGNPRCAVHAEIHSICTARPWLGPAAGVRVSPTSDTCQSVAILMNRRHSSATLSLK